MVEAKMALLPVFLLSVPNYWTWTRTTPRKKWFLWSNPYKLEVSITSVREMLELPNFGQVTNIIWQYNLNYEIRFCWWHHWQKLCVTTFFFQNIFTLRRPGVAIFSDTIKSVTMFIKTIFKDSIKVKRVRIYASKCSLYLYFLI